MRVRPGGVLLELVNFDGQQVWSKDTVDVAKGTATLLMYEPDFATGGWKITFQTEAFGGTDDICVTETKKKDNSPTVLVVIIVCVVVLLVLGGVGAVILWHKRRSRSGEKREPHTSFENNPAYNDSSDASGGGDSETSGCDGNGGGPNLIGGTERGDEYEDNDDEAADKPSVIPVAYPSSATDVNA